MPAPLYHDRRGAGAACGGRRATLVAMSCTEAIEGLYAALRPYRSGRNRVSGCPCCVSEEDEWALLARPLRELPPEHLSGFAFSALSTWGGARDLKHFLPRICELLAAPRPLPVDAQIVFSKLPQADFAAWPAAEREAVAAFLCAAFDESLSTYPSAGNDPQTWLESAGLALGDVGPLLRRWAAREDGAAASHLAELITGRAEEILGGRLRFVWWQGEGGAVASWLREEGPRALLLRCFERDPAAPPASDWALALDTLELLPR